MLCEFLRPPFFNRTPQAAASNIRTNYLSMVFMFAKQHLRTYLQVGFSDFFIKIKRKQNELF